MPQPGGELDPTVVVVPCYDEADRLDLDAFRGFAAARPWLRFVLVDDGSRDATRERLEELAKEPHRRFEVIGLPINRGKAEAVRRGITDAIAGDAACVGFWDADLATPLSEIDRFRAHLREHPDVEILLGSRVRLLGYRIDRNAIRHYFGRVAATLVALILDLPVYDTQCGAKLFRVTPAVRSAFQDPFTTRWEFDVEILARWLLYYRSRGVGPLDSRIHEIPLLEWVDVAGSRLHLIDFVRAPLELVRLYLRYPGLRRKRPAASGTA